jgi:aromatic ring-opening dioxygenase catalytic subunit (LigB family)
VTASSSPPMVYDFSAFPEHLYRNRYPAPGCPELARLTQALIRQTGLTAHLDLERGFDQGVYSILAITHPHADVPVIQVSIRGDYDPDSHLRLGRALAPLRDEGVLIIGSGSSYNNFHPNDVRTESALFDAWLRDTLVDTAPQQRSARLLEWARAPAGRLAHPHEDHLVPLHVAVGAAEQDPGQVIYREQNFFGRITISSYRFG